MIYNNMKYNNMKYRPLMSILREVEINDLNLDDTFIRVDDTKAKITYKLKLSKLKEYLQSK